MPIWYFGVLNLSLIPCYYKSLHYYNSIHIHEALKFQKQFTSHFTVFKESVDFTPSNGQIPLMHQPILIESVVYFYNWESANFHWLRFRGFINSRNISTFLILWNSLPFREFMRIYNNDLFKYNTSPFLVLEMCGNFHFCTLFWRLKADLIKSLLDSRYPSIFTGRAFTFARQRGRSDGHLPRGSSRTTGIDEEKL